MSLEKTYWRLVESCSTVNQINRLHINLERRLLPEERARLIRVIRRRAGVLGGWVVDARPLRSLARAALKRTGKRDFRDLEILNWGARWTQRQRVLGPGTYRWQRVRVTRGYGLYQRSEYPSRKLLVGWTGATNLMMLPTPDFLRAMEFLDADILLLWHGHARDFSEGIPGLGNRYERAVEALAGIVDSLGYVDRICMGVSGGGLPALGSSVPLRAKNVYVLGVLNPSKAERHFSWPNFVERFAMSPERPWRTIVIAGEDSLVDSENATKVASALGGEVVSVRGAGHGILYSLFQRGHLESWLKDLFKSENQVP